MLKSLIEKNMKLGGAGGTTWGSELTSNEKAAWKKGRQKGTNKVMEVISLSKNFEFKARRYHWGRKKMIRASRSQQVS